MPPVYTDSVIPEAPPATIPNAGSRSDGFSPAAIIGIVVAILFLLLLVPLIAILLRRYESTRLRETPKSSGSSLASLRSHSHSHSQEEQPNLGSILVTKELLRSSVRMERVDSGINRPDQIYGNGRDRTRGWSVTEVRGGELNK
ncbi:hypothetical protein A1F94_005644 [Pyrenophora tritici-repentis]|uniref:Uncharacterized protein n=2 Tax=Pyrenophora tritici-repentis TaxID=45151 RepID=A0A317A4Z8_9PLEO|nr:uncharacterized protein PTRG_05767 [Pyrenophora tritici-repentis Pt-1C-BFP]KAA8618855.1 hypothetical protein PtrV1_08284 [Pyrenophora tritici-repentis]EDU48687.1 predicted protein [Pyrenophora tritici-repentis Pt-1C-BFP]KAF7570662.1 hypothetical protein PtrM4_106640 [Pyrenophora tritici-repentis]KAG9383733.1 hypothetical protein A1F94_005644 [Pyrenophora tritici-repentis]KAI0585246.1 hypothetical protein Alg215_02637 [Pyrenophora tritici-repentis]